MIATRASRWKLSLVAPACLALACCTTKEAQPVASAPNTESRALASLPPAPAPGQAPPLARLDGLTADELRAALGAPTLLRTDGPAELWQYAGAGCVLHVFLDRSSGTLRVEHADTRIDDPSAGSPPTCVPWRGSAPAS